MRDYFAFIPVYPSNGGRNRTTWEPFVQLPSKLEKIKQDLLNGTIATKPPKERK